jgi:hypothetical protein
MRPFCWLLPLCFVRWYALKYCERFHDNGLLIVNPLPGVIFEVPE